MFTGLVEEAGEIVRFAREEATDRYALEVRAPTVAEGAAAGDSVAVNGCCLTATAAGDGGLLRFDLLGETVRLTNFAELAPGRRVNLERSLLPTTRMGGHMVSGHVDERGRVEVFEPRGADHYLRVRTDPEALRYLVPKGSIAVDGISLTVAEVLEDGFAVWLIPHTLEVTNLRERVAGETVNLEYDLLAKYVERMLQARAPEGTGTAGA